MPLDALAGGATRAVPRRSKRSADHRDGSGALGSPIAAEEKTFRAQFLSRETGIDSVQARELVDRIEGDGAALLDAARRAKIMPRD
jgi:hypothetical protein